MRLNLNDVRWLFCLCIYGWLYFISLQANAQSQIVMREVTATGNGGDVSSATIDAIENAIGQVGGMKISAATSLSLSEVTKGDKTTIEENFKQNIERMTRGMIKSYKVLESGTSPGSGRAFVKIRAVIPSYKPSEQLKRMKLAVLPLVLRGKTVGNPDAASFGNTLSSSLESYLTQTRKFAMIDRRNTAKSNQELKGANARNAPIEETLKFGVRVGADYIVLVALNEFAPQQTQQERVTGKVVTRLSAPVAVDVRVIDIATGQIKFAQTYNNPGRLPSSSALQQYATDIGVDLGQLISAAIYPIAVVSGNDKEVTFNQGGDTVQTGRSYRLVTLGKKLTDPYTKESLGQEETEIAIVEVTSVTDRIATARLVSGNLPSTVVSGSLLARLLPDEPSLALNLQLTLPTLPGSGSTSSGAGNTKKDDQDW